MAACTIKIRPNTKRTLDGFRKCLDENYDEVISRLIDAMKNRSAPKLGRNAIERIKRARKMINADNSITEAKAKERLKI